jgi:hypothetical protein
MPTNNINSCPQTIFTNPVLQNEVEKLVKNLKEKHSSGFDDVTDYCKEMCAIYQKNH